MDGPRKTIVAIAVVFLVTTWVTTLLRLYVRAVMIKNFGIEDYLSAIALGLFTTSAGIALKGIAVSGGRRFADLTLPQIKNSMMWWFLLELFYTVTITVIRASIAVFLLRITTLRSHVIIIWSVLTLITAYSIFYFFFVIFQCNPPASFWTEVGGNSTFCVKASTFGAVTYVHSSLGALTDWVLALIPVFLLSGLQMNSRTKISVSVILGLGGIAAIAVIIRIPYVKILVNSTDFLYDCTNVVIWTSIEPGLGLTAASMATLRPLFQASLGRTRFFSSTRTPRTANHYGKSSRSHSRSKFSISALGSKSGYLRSTSKGRDSDFELQNARKGTVTTVIDSPGFEDRDGDEGGLGIFQGQTEMRSMTTTHKRSESQSRLKRIAEWNHSGGDSIGEGSRDSDEGPGREPPIHIRKTVEIRTQSGILS